MPTSKSQIIFRTEEGNKKYCRVSFCKDFMLGWIYLSKNQIPCWYISESFVRFFVNIETYFNSAVLCNPSNRPIPSLLKVSKQDKMKKFGLIILLVAILTDLNFQLHFTYLEMDRKLQVKEEGCLYLKSVIVRVEIPYLQSFISKIILQLTWKYIYLQSWH